MTDFPTQAIIMQEVIYMDKKEIGERIKTLRKESGLSQEDLANYLGVSRVVISSIEIGQRELKLIEAKKIAEIFNIGIEELLEEETPEVILEKKKVGSKRKKIRISVPQERVDKFKEVLLYILNKVGAKPNIGETVLYKLLYFIDFDFYEKYEEQLIGAKYIKNHYGPTPVEFKKIVDSMIQNRELIKIEDEYFKYPQRKYLPLREPDLSILKAHEKELIDEVLAKLSDMNATQISEYSHNDVPWMVAKNGEIIDYETVFYRTPPYSVRIVSDSILKNRNKPRKNKNILLKRRKENEH